MKVFLIIVGVLVFINILPVGAHVIFDENGLVLKAVAGLIQIKLLPKKPKPKKEPTEKEIEESKKKKAEKAAKKSEKKRQKALKKLQKKEKPKDKKPIGALIEEFLPLVKVGLEAISDLPRLPTIHKLKLRVTYGSGDPAQAAKNYGMAWAAIGTIMSYLTRHMRIRRHDVQPVLDYGCTSMRVAADATVTFTLGRFLHYLIHYGVKALKVILANKKAQQNKEKAVLQNESSSS